jgi:hypothetical protein
MKLRTVATALAVVFSTAPATAAARHPSHRRLHRPGCETRSCDHRIDRWLAERLRRHRARFFDTATASFYNDAGPTACGNAHYRYGFAHLGPGEGAYPGMACGTRVRFCAERCVTGTMQDHGPYVAGREYDLNPALKAAIGASDLGTVRVRVLAHG